MQFAARRKLHNPTPTEARALRIRVDRPERVNPVPITKRLTDVRAEIDAAVIKMRADREQALAERDAWNGQATQEQVDAWASKYSRIYFPGTGGYPLSNVNVVPFPKQPVAPVQTPPMIFFGDVRNRPRLRYLIQGFLAEGATSSVFGAPKTNKSTVVVDAGVHLAAGKDWRGYRVKQARGVVYFAFERSAQILDSLEAYAVRDGFKDLPFAVVPRLFDMMNAGCIEIIAEAIRTAEARLGIPVGLVVFDTWNKGIAAGGGSEDKAEHQNAAAANLRRLIEQFPTLHCLTIGHTGKDATKGERGSNATMGDRDVGVLIEAAGSIRSMSIAYANSLPEGRLTTFEGEATEIGKSDDGEPETGYIVSARILAAPIAVGPRLAPKSNLKPVDNLAEESLKAAIRNKGQHRPEFPGGPSVTVNDWLDECLTTHKGVGSGQPMRDLERRQVNLIAAGRIVMQDNLVRLNFPVPPPIPTRP